MNRLAYSTHGQVIENEADWNNFWGNLEEDFDAINLTGLLHDWVDPLRDLHAAYFASETTPDGTAWPELSQATIDRKGHDTILVDTGRLRESLTGGSSDSILDIYDEGTNKGLVFGTEVEYSQYHNPARAHVGINEKTLDQLAEEVVDEALELWASG